MNAYPPSIHHRVQFDSWRAAHMHNQDIRYVDVGIRLASRAKWTEQATNVVASGTAVLPKVQTSFNKV